MLVNYPIKVFGAVCLPGFKTIQINYLRAVGYFL